MNALMFAPFARRSALGRRPWLCGALPLVVWVGAAVAQVADPLTSAASPPITLRGHSYPDFGALYPSDALRQPGAMSPQAIHYTDITGWLTPRQASSLGLTLGVVSYARGVELSPQAFDLGVRWRSQLDRRVQLDIHAWARTSQLHAKPNAMGMIWHQNQPTFGTRVEVQWSSSRTRGLVPEFGAVGLQLEGNSRLLLRARRGGPMLYYRTKF